MRKTSVKALARQATRDDAKARAAAFPSPKPGVKASKSPTSGQPLVAPVTMDNFINLAHKMGVGADNPLTTASYGFNPITRNRQLLEWMYRGSWLAGAAIDCVAEDMTRAGVEFVTELAPEDAACMEQCATKLAIWPKLAEAIKWGRLYGGGIAVHMVEGQDFRTPLRTETIGAGQYKGLLVLDRWMLEPDLTDLVTDLGPDLGLPKYYKVHVNAPALRGAVIHYSRIALRHIGIQLPYNQALTENLWGESVLERINDRMLSYDSASSGAAQLVYKAFLRTLKVEGLRDIVAAGGAALQGLVAYTENMRRFQNIEGLSLIDASDELDVQGSAGTFSGLDDILMQFAMQLSGALQIPLTRLLGQSPAGLNSTGESDMRNYYDGISQDQNAEMHTGVTTTYRCIAASEGITLSDDFELAFASLWQMKPEEKANVAKTVGDAIGGAYENGLIGRQTSLRELRQVGRLTGVFTNITDEAIEEADDEVMAPMAEMEMGLEHEADQADADREHQASEADKAREHAAKEADKGRQHAERLAKEKGKQQRKPLVK
jgi:hypothetical protein